MKLIQALCIVFIVIISGCNTEHKALQVSIPSSFYSDAEGKYYITAIGVADEENLEFQRVFDQNIDIISGYYQTGSPGDQELQMLSIDDGIPKYVVFDTEKEILRTTDLNELSTFLKLASSK